MDMSIPSFLLADTIRTTVAQRLVRLLCPTCKTKKDFDRSFFPRNFKPHKIITTQCIPKGCSECFNTGYKGRKAVYEVIPIDEELAGQIRNRSSNIGDLLRERGIRTLSENAFELFEQGLTSLEEIYTLLAN
jgi:general secretion pathway protein E/type IV pilus assembly protein PilB